MYWQEPGDKTPITIAPLTRVTIGALTFGIFFFGIFPQHPALVGNPRAPPDHAHPHGGALNFHPRSVRRGEARKMD